MFETRSGVGWFGVTDNVRDGCEPIRADLWQSAKPRLGSTGSDGSSARSLQARLGLKLVVSLARIADIQSLALLGSKLVRVELSSVQLASFLMSHTKCSQIEIQYQM
jgi:hypothetical protein